MVLLAGCALYLGVLLRGEMKNPAVATEEIEVFDPPPRQKASTLRDLGRILIGLLALVIGRNILNILLILGVTAMVHPLPAKPSMLTFEIPVMLGVSVLLLVLAARRSAINRWEGGLLVTGYVAFLAFVFTKGAV